MAKAARAHVSWVGALLLVVLVFQAGCLRPATGVPSSGHVVASSFRYRPLTPPLAPKEDAPDVGLEGAAVCEVEFLEPGGVSTRPVPIDKAEFKRTVEQLTRGLGRSGSPREVEKQFRGLLKWNHQGVDMVDLKTGRKYEILSGTESNLAPHGRRMAGEFFRMLTF